MKKFIKFGSYLLNKSNTEDLFIRYSFSILFYIYTSPILFIMIIAKIFMIISTILKLLSFVAETITAILTIKFKFTTFKYEVSSIVKSTFYTTYL